PMTVVVVGGGIVGLATAYYLAEAGEDLFVVFDEAHHAPANTYRRLLQGLKESHSELHLLGLTATPTYTDDDKRGWLWELFSEGILHQSAASELIAAGILAEPDIEQVHVDFTPDFPEDKFQKWSRSNRDLPQYVVEQLAENRERNIQIADHYAANRDKYGKTLILADRRIQCVMIETALNDRGVKAASVMSKRDAQPLTPEERNRRNYDSNDEAIHDFREGELDVLVNVRMLTEGTDVPDAETVFLTRKTTSRILLTQMIGRAMRGPRFGGTEKANLVAFIDRWRHLIQWAEFDQLGGGLDDTDTARWVDDLPEPE
ncbi:MAG: DEAD/DEAH box helicase, partial [Bradymonadaceae bacterium]